MTEDQVRQIVREEFAALMAQWDQKEAEAEETRRYYEELNNERARKRAEAQRRMAEDEARRLRWRIEDLERGRK